MPKVPAGRYVRYPNERLWNDVGLTRLTGEVGQPCVGEGMTSSKSPVREPSTLVRRVRRGNVVNVETETPALWRQSPETATPPTLD